jgi:glucan phosphorylase
MEASGTSGQKAAINGVPSLSTPDGWWLEGFTGSNGWTIGVDAGTGGSEGEGAERDETDADAIYTLLEQKIVPLYYERDDEGIPEGWVAVMKEAIRNAGARFSTRRMLLDYVAGYYFPSTHR